MLQIGRLGREMSEILSGYTCRLEVTYTYVQCTYIYRIRMSQFRGAQFSQIDHFKRFMETIFADPLLLAAPLNSILKFHELI